MVSESWQKKYAAKMAAPQEALAHIRNGQTVFVGSGAGEPLVLTDTLYEMAPRFCDIEVIQLATAQEHPKLAGRELAGSFLYNAFYIGRHGSETAADMFGDYTAMNISELPKAMANGVIRVDVALIHVSPPDSAGMCSLGVSVDATKAAANNATLVIAQVNKNMPPIPGDSLVPADAIDFLVEGDMPLPSVPPPEVDPVFLTIGRHIARLITDGMTLHFDGGPIGTAAMRYLDTRQD